MEEENKKLIVISNKIQIRKKIFVNNTFQTLEYLNQRKQLLADPKNIFLQQNHKKISGNISFLTQQQNFFYINSKNLNNTPFQLVVKLKLLLLNQYFCICCIRKSLAQNKELIFQKYQTDSIEKKALAIDPIKCILQQRISSLKIQGKAQGLILKQMHGTIKVQFKFKIRNAQNQNQARGVRNSNYLLLIFIFKTNFDQ
ncbi:unnamed protein product [Paramecium sonneborni]|uniref:Uncharacterized protein n=1 Tax=Paramecium sonneborni TaxID=65129 RepID=A0A8S1QJ14_9CILI|nr:unnamed protein product [Paramecium sonneborni]